MNTLHTRRSLSTSRGLFLVLLLLVLGAGVALAAVLAAKVILVTGDATATATSGEVRVLSRGVDLFEGDTVETQVKSYVKLRYTDGGAMLIRPSSRLKIAKYVAPDPGEGSQVTELLKGGMRAVTGAITKKKPENWEMKTPVATIGVRGTDFVARYCNGDCTDLSEFGVPAPADGLWVFVYEGRLEICNNAGCIIVEAGQGAWVADADTMPVLLTEGIPGILAGDRLPSPLADNALDFIEGNECATP